MMKITKTVALTTLFFALVLESLSASPELLVDSNGEQVRAHTYYYVIPGVLRIALGLGFAKGRYNKCPLDVAQIGYPGLAVAFSPADDKDDIIYTSTDVNIYFAQYQTPCNESLIWKVDNYDQSNGKWFITTGGVKGNPGPQTLQNWFKFEGSKGIYKLVHCPSVNGSSVKLCGDIGFAKGRRLALSDTPFFYTLVKVKEDMLIREMPSV